MPSQRTCSIPGCGSLCRARGWCGKHYMRWHEYGDPSYLKPRPAKPPCTVPACGRPHAARGYCKFHWKRWRSRGTTDDPPKREGPRRCSRCGGAGPFRKRAKSPDGLQGYCASCANESFRKSRQTPQGRANALAHAKDQQRRKYALIVKIKLERGCADCGYRGHHAALQFDHVRGEKLFDVSGGQRGKSVTSILAEIEKCEVVCANCHSIRTYERLQVRKAGVTAHEETEAPAKLW